MPVRLALNLRDDQIGAALNTPLDTRGAQVHTNTNDQRQGNDEQRSGALHEDPQNW